MHLFNRKQVRITQSVEEERRLTLLLERAGVETLSRSGSLTNPGRYHGVPGVKNEYAYEYRIYVKKADYDRAERILRENG